MAQQSNFNFDQYNSLLKSAPVGLKLHLAVQMMKDIVSSLEYFDNPLEAELRPIYVEFKAFHTVYKEKAKAIAEKKANESERTASIDNSTIPQVGVQDMMAMFAEFKRMMDFKSRDELAAAQSAQTSIDQIGNGELHALGDKTGTNG